MYAAWTPPRLILHVRRLQMGNDLRDPKKHLAPHRCIINVRSCVPGWTSVHRVSLPKYCFLVRIIMDTHYDDIC